jgi:hypothetical protein
MGNATHVTKNTSTTSATKQSTNGQNMAKGIKGTASSGARARAAKRTKAVLEGRPLADLRRAREFSQTTLPGWRSPNQSV